MKETSSQQIMADLPAYTVVPSPPFTIVGVDVFGPRVIEARRTRGGLARQKKGLYYSAVSHLGHSILRSKRS